MSKALVSALLKLNRTLSSSLSGSQFTENQKEALMNFEAKTQAIQCLKKGRGITFKIIDSQVVETHLNHHSPGYDGINKVPERAANIALNRNSKGGKSNHEKAYILLKTVNNPCWMREGKLIIELNQNTEQFGICALEIGNESNTDLTTTHSIWLVENQALFDQLDWLPTNEPTTVIWYRGHLSNKLIDWLTINRTAKVYLFADYDGVGLNNYARITTKLGNDVEFWLMPEWNRLLSTYGSDEVWKSTKDDVHHFLKTSEQLLANKAELKELIIEMQKQGLALEQEAVWLA